MPARSEGRHRTGARFPLLGAKGVFKPLATKIMGQQHRKVIKRSRRKDYLKRKKEQAKMNGVVKKRPAVKKDAKEAPAKKAAKKATKKVATKKVAKKAAKKAPEKSAEEEKSEE